MDIIDPKKICGKILDRSDCTNYRYGFNSCYVKDLYDLNIDLKDVVIIDNMPDSY